MLNERARNKLDADRLSLHYANANFVNRVLRQLVTGG